jgi:hypothetical protein
MSASTFVARAMAWWLRLFFTKRGEKTPPHGPLDGTVPDACRGSISNRWMHSTYRVIPPGVDREAFRKVQRAARKMQRKIEAGTMTEAEALRALGIEVDA